MKILADGSLLGLIERGERSVVLVRIPSAFVGDDRDRSGTPAVVRDEDSIVLHEFDQEDGFVPSRLIVGDKKSRQHVLVSDAGNRAWKIFSLGRATATNQVEALEGHDGEASDFELDVVEDSMLVD